MKLEITFISPQLEKKIDRVIHLLEKGFTKMAGEIDALLAEVAATRDAEDAMMLLLQRLHDLISSGDPAKIAEATNLLATKRAEAVAAVIANTPAA